MLLYFVDELTHAFAVHYGRFAWNFAFLKFKLVLLFKSAVLSWESFVQTFYFFIEGPKEDEKGTSLAPDKLELFYWHCLNFLMVGNRCLSNGFEAPVDLRQFFWLHTLSKLLVSLKQRGKGTLVSHQSLWRGFQYRKGRKRYLFAWFWFNFGIFTIHHSADFSWGQLSDECGRLFNVSVHDFAFDINLLLIEDDHVMGL
jgi:hypothetical protein